MHRAAVRSVGPPRALAVDGDHPDRRCRGWCRGSQSQPGRDYPVEGLGVDGLQGAADCRLARRRPPQTEPDPHPNRQVVGPFGDRGERARPCQHGADPDRQDRDEPVPHPAARTRIAHRRQRGKQIDRRRISTRRRPPRPGSENRDRRRWTSGHGSRSGDRAGVATVMITSGAVSAPLLPHHRRVGPQTRRNPRLCRGPGPTLGWIGTIDTAPCYQVCAYRALRRRGQFDQ